MGGRLFSQVIYSEPAGPASNRRHHPADRVSLNLLIRHCFDGGSQNIVNSFCIAT
jgi:hypothetical protein